MNSTQSSNPFPATPMDALVANDLGAYQAVGNLGEAFLALVLRTEMAPLKQAHREGAETFHEVLAACVKETVTNHPCIGEGGLGDDFRSVLSQACTVLAYGPQHRLFPNLMGYCRHRLGRHVLIRPDLVRELMGADPQYASVFERSLATLAAVSDIPPAELLLPTDAEPEGEPVQCAFCDRAWVGKMPQLQTLPASVEKQEDWDPSGSSRESMMELSGEFFRVSLSGDSPLSNVCHHGHVMHILSHERGAVFDPWVGELAVGFLEPEDHNPLVTGWRKFE